MNYFVYILQSVQCGRWYIGSIQDTEKRLSDHNSGKCRSSKPFVPYKIVYKEVFSTRGDARRREIQIKKSGRIRKDIKDRIEATAPSSNG